MPPTDGAPADAPGTPWERRAELGLWTGWTRTVSQALLEPGKLYASARLDRGGAQLGFALATGAVFCALGQILDRLLFGRQRAQLLQLWREQVPGASAVPPWVRRFLESSSRSSVRDTILFALLAPVLVLVLLYASAAVTHLCALVFGQNRRGFPATFAATAYGFAPLVLLAVPGCGSLAALIWCAVLTGVGLKTTHGISSGGAAATALAPYALLCCASCAFSLALGVVAARMVQAAG